MPDSKISIYLSLKKSRYRCDRECMYIEGKGGRRQIPMLVTAHVTPLGSSHRLSSCVHERVDLIYTTMSWCFVGDEPI